MITYIIIIAVCLIMSAYFSATETAFSSMNKARLKAFCEKGNKKADLALSISEKYDRLLSTILIGNNIVNILVSSIATIIFAEELGFGNELGATIATVVVTIAVLIFGEITPKTLARENAERFAMFSAPLLKLFLGLLLPLNWLFSFWQSLIGRIFKVEEKEKISQEELLIMVDEVEQEGSIDTEESELLRNAIEFTERRAEDILTHRVDVEAVPLNSTKKDIAKAFTTTRFSRLLVYEDNIDNIVGVIHQKDFYVDGGVYPSDIKEIIATPTFIHQTEKISNLLKILQKEKSHIAVVLDEYGGTLGIVTMEDILEELVGEIWDEHDEVVEDYENVEENVWTVDASVNLEDFAEKFNVDVDEAESVSLGGWVTEQLGKIPEENDSFTFGNLFITVVECDAHRVVSIRVEKTENEDEENKEEE